MPDFTKGHQPCRNYDPEDADVIIQGIPNQHECLAPFDREGPRCAETHGGRVSFCLTCHRDHHSNGYESCAAWVRAAVLG